MSFRFIEQRFIQPCAHAFKCETLTQLIQQHCKTGVIFVRFRFILGPRSFLAGQLDGRVAFEIDVVGEQFLDLGLVERIPAV